MTARDATPCPLCSTTHTHAPNDQGNVSFVCPYSGRRLDRPGRGDPSAALPYLQRADDEWLRLTLGFLFDERDRRAYVAAWRVAGGGHGPSAEDIAAAAIDELVRRQRTGAHLEPRVRLYDEQGRECPPEPAAPAARGSFAFARVCPFCSGPKVNAPRTPYVYCDFCGRYFDEDLAGFSAIPGALDPQRVWAGIMQGFEPLLRAARTRGDRVGYAERWREFYTYYLLMAFRTTSPRVWDPRWRGGVVDGFLVPLAVEKNFDPVWREIWDRAKGVGQGPLEAWAVLSELVSCEAEICERLGLFAAHPDGLDPGLFHRVNALAFARDWMPRLDGEAQSALVRHLGLEAVLTPLDPPPVASVSCGACGRPLDQPLGATRTLCDACGLYLDPPAAGLSCRGCGARLAFVAGAPAARCPHCDVEAVRV